ncbi:MAG TPA: DUF3043 domain-containing protein [Mycobacteriales bacterium]|nr:DUF3043 domain-containing protein [Mycobacteriales bacterium]
MTASAPPPGGPAGPKGRPTPKRKEKERRRSGPVAPPPLTRKEAAQRQKEQQREARQRVREGALRGEERYLPKRDAGPVRKLVRDVVDARRNAGVLLLPIALFLVLAQITGNRFLFDVALVLWMAGLLTVLLDLVVLGATIRRRVRREFPDEQRTRGHVAYGLLRSTVFRRWRMPAAAPRT